jgi:hypothetical protein
MRNSLVVLSMFALAACREKAPAPVDSSLAQDLALAQNAAVTPQFNDAPIGGNAAASAAKGAPAPNPAPPRAKAPAPRPTPRRDSPPERVRREPQQTTPQPVATEPSPAPAPGPAAGIIGAGSKLAMNTNAQLCTVNLLPGDKVSATVTSGITGSNGAQIPAGSLVVLEVASVNRAEPVENTRIEYRVYSIDVNGQSTAATGDVTQLGTLERMQSGSATDKQKVIGGAVAGAVLGRIFGKSTKATVIGAAAGAAAGTVAARRGGESDACLPKGSPMRVTVGRDIIARTSAM